eukprot:scaffold8935_cov167-Skeletonema_marinoi.AAC.1
MTVLSSSAMSMCRSINSSSFVCASFFWRRRWILLYLRLAAFSLKLLAVFGCSSGVPGSAEYSAKLE